MREQLDSSTSQKHPTLQQAIRRSLLLFSVGIGIIGLCGLATLTSETTNTDRSRVSTSWKTIEDTSSQKDTSSAINAEPFSAVAPLPETTVHETSKEQAAKSCNKKLESAAVKAKKQALATENSHHQRAVKWLKTTGQFMRYFAPSVYTAKLETEQQKHINNIARINATFNAAIKKADCNLKS